MRAHYCSSRSWRLIAARPPTPNLATTTRRMAAVTPPASTAALELADAERAAADTAALAAADGALTGPALLRRLRAVYATSGACGARVHSQTSVSTVRDGPLGEVVEFVLRVLPSLSKKPQGGAKAAAAATGGGRRPSSPPPPPLPANPFLPYDPRLFVANLSATHVLLLNKFDVVPLHALVVTRAFEPQTDPLRAADLGATWEAMAALASSSSSGSSSASASSSSSEGGGALAFYNCGEHSGRSQPHKHVQVVPLPFRARREEAAGGRGEEGDGGGDAPVAALVRRALEEQQQQQQQGGPLFAEVRSLPFRAYAAPAPPLTTTPQTDDGAAFAALERALAAMVARCAADCGGGGGAPSYNLLLAGGWAVAVPRRSERDRPGDQGVSVAVNALGFAGTLLCKSDDELAHARSKGPLAVLADAGWPW